MVVVGRGQQRRDQWFQPLMSSRSARHSNLALCSLFPASSRVHILVKHVDHSEDDIFESCKPDRYVVASDGSEFALTLAGLQNSTAPSTSSSGSTLASSAITPSGSVGLNVTTSGPFTCTYMFKTSIG